MKKLVKTNPNGDKQWLCKCRCGTLLTVSQASLRSFNTKSCGCLQKERSAEAGRKHSTTHGMWKHPLYAACQQAIMRCHNKSHLAYSNYGARGIRVHKVWRNDVGKFIAYLLRYLGPRPQNKSLDRVNNDEGYKPGNLRWATKKQQAQNRRSSKRYK